MGTDRIRHLVERKNAAGVLYFWQPSATLKRLGLTSEALGSDYQAAKARAIEINSLADEMRRGQKTGNNGPLPGTIAKLFRDFQSSDEFADLKDRTRKDYAYYLGKIEAEFGKYQVRNLTPKVIKTYYQRVRREVSVTWAYHILSHLRGVLTWAVSEDWIEDNPALKVTMKSPEKRKVKWEAEQAATYIAKATELEWESVAVMAYVFDSTGQSPVDVRTMLRGAYDGRTIDVMRTKTGVEGAPIPLVT